VTVGFDVAFDAPFYGGSAGSSFEAGLSYPVSLGGVTYGLDTVGYDYQHSSVPMLRQAQDDQGDSGRPTLNPEAFWRRTFESWHVGAGQTYFDRVDDSNPWRFRRSKGINVWDRYQISLLPGTDAKLLSAATNLRLVVAGGFLYLTDGTLLRRTADITVDTPTWTTITGGTAATFSSIASDGFNVLLACGASGIDKTTRGAATKANHITGTVAQVAYGKGRWIATQDNILYDITTLVVGGGALPAALFTHPNTDFDWNCFAEGPTAFYAGGFSGDKSLIYRLTIKEDGTGLNQPVVAGFLPDGELIQSMQGYLGFVLIGTSLGVRVGIVGGNGDLTIGALIPTDQPVLSFEGQDRFVWFGWGGFEGETITGLGRINLETFSDSESLAPAYASDLMTSTLDANTTTIVTFQGLRVFSANGTAGSVWAEDPAVLVSTGQIDTGIFDYGITDPKLSLFIDTSHPGTHGGTHSVSLSLDGGTFVSLGEFSHGFPIATGEARAHTFELRFVLNRDSVDLDEGAAVTSAAMRVQPAPPLTEQIIVPLLIAPDQTRVDGFREARSSVAQAEHIRGLRQTQQVVQYVEGSRQWPVIVVDYQLDIKEWYVGSDAALGINATCLTRLKVVQ